LRTWPRAPVAFQSIIASLVPMLLLPGTAFAQLTAKLSATGEYQYDTNVFDVQTGFPIPGTNDYHYSDSYYAYGAALGLNEQISQQNLYLNATGTEFTYDHFTELTHDEYNFNGGWNWKIGRNLDGTFEVLRTRSMVAFTEVTQLELAIDTEQREQANIGFQFLPRWRIEANGYTRKLLEPLPGQPNLQLTESNGGAALKYLGTAGLTSGLSADFTHGNYSGTNGRFNPAYDQKTVALVATYQPSAPSGPLAPNSDVPTGPAGRSTFDGAVGYSKRTSPTGFNSVSGLTGHLDYTNQLTGKTSAQVDLDRTINSYLTNSGSEIDTSAGVKALWQATYKIGVAAGYTWTYRYLPGQGYVSGTDRGDHLQYASLTIDYEALPWLAIKPYANIQTRNSNYYGGNFNATVYGVSFTVQWQNRRS
jgi:hypothetical protein